MVASLRIFVVFGKLVYQNIVFLIANQLGGVRYPEPLPRAALLATCAVKIYTMCLCA